MKRTLLVLSVATILTFLAGTTASQARVYVGVGVGFGGGHGYYHGGYSHGYYGYHDYFVGGPYPYYYSPTVVYADPAPTVVYTTPPPVTVVEPATPPPAPAEVPASSVPYGFIQSGGVLKSPYSNFSMGVGGHSSGDVVYDANNGRPFKVP